jgi:hypothetical protein
MSKNLRYSRFDGRRKPVPKKEQKPLPKAVDNQAQDKDTPSTDNQ